MATTTERPVCGLCRKVYNENLDGDSWHEGPFDDPGRDREYDHLCPECYAVVVEGEPEERDWILERYPTENDVRA